MSRNPDAKRRLLKAIYDLKFATIYNLAFESRGTNKDSCLVGVGRHIRQLEKAGLVLPVRPYDYLQNEKYCHTFWQAMKEGAKALGYESNTRLSVRSQLGIFPTNSS